MGALTAKEATVLIGCRSRPRAEAARATLVEYGLENLELLELKLADLRSVSAAADIGLRARRGRRQRKR